MGHGEGVTALIGVSRETPISTASQNPSAKTRRIGVVRRAVSGLLVLLALSVTPAFAYVDTVSYYQTEDAAFAAAYALTKSSSPPGIVYSYPFGPFYGRVCPNCGDFGEWINDAELNARGNWNFIPEGEIH